MSICRFKKHHKNFVIIDKTGLVDDRLSWRAKGILAYFMTLPDDWKIKLNEIITHATDGKVAFTSGLKELKKLGYCETKETRNLDGTIKELEYIVYEYPNMLTEGSPLTRNPLAGYPELKELDQVDRPLLRNNNTKEKNNTNVLFSSENLTAKKTVSRRGKKKSPAAFHPETLGGRLAQYMLDEIEKHNPTFLNPELGLWERFFNKMIYVERKAHSEIEEIIWYSQSNDFWKSIILNPFVLNAKYETLKIQLAQLRKKQNRETEKEDIFEQAKKNSIY